MTSAGGRPHPSYQQDQYSASASTMDASNRNRRIFQGHPHDDGDHYIQHDPDNANHTHAPNSDSHLRSLVKGISYRIISSLATIIISFAVLGDVSVALEIGFVDFFAKILIYYLHERAWSKITFI